MDHIGIDVHKKDSQICTLAEGGELLEQRIRTEPERFAAVRGERPRARDVVPAGQTSRSSSPPAKRVRSDGRLRSRHPRRTAGPPLSRRQRRR